MDDEKKSFSEESSEYFTWFVFLAAIGVLLLFLLRRSLIRFFPILFVLSLFIPLIIYLYRRHKYRGLEAVYTEYALLVPLLKARGMTTYIQLVERSMVNMLAARDKAETITWLLKNEDIEKTKAYICDLKRQLENCNDQDQRVLLERNLKESLDNYQRINDLKPFLEKFESSKMLLAGYFKNIRLKIQMEKLKSEIRTSSENDEIDQIVSDIEILNQAYERVDELYQ